MTCLLMSRRAFLGDSWCLIACVSVSYQGSALKVHLVVVLNCQNGAVMLEISLSYAVRDALVLLLTRACCCLCCCSLGIKQQSSLMGPSLTLPICKGRLALGTWQGIYLNEHRCAAGLCPVVIIIFELHVDRRAGGVHHTASSHLVPPPRGTHHYIKLLVSSPASGSSTVAAGSPTVCLRPVSCPVPYQPWGQQ
jgi:hypothetical protein